MRDAAIIQTGLGHITESYADSQPLSDKFAHLVTFAINLPTTIEGDGSFWGYALGLVDMETFKEGAEYCDIERLRHFIEALQKVIAIKLSIEAGHDT